MSGYWLALVIGFGLMAGAASALDAWPAVIAASVGAFMSARAAADSILDDEEYGG